MAFPLQQCQYSELYEYILSYWANNYKHNEYQSSRERRWKQIKTTPDTLHTNVQYKRKNYAYLEKNFETVVKVKMRWTKSPLGNDPNYIERYVFFFLCVCGKCNFEMHHNSFFARALLNDIQSNHLGLDHYKFCNIHERGHYQRLK